LTANAVDTRIGRNISLYIVYERFSSKVKPFEYLKGLKMA